MERNKDTPTTKIGCRKEWKLLVFDEEKAKEELICLKSNY
jgi:hypothetical protein